MQNVDSEKKVLVDGEELANGQEKKLGIGMKIKFGDEDEWQVSLDTLYLDWKTHICYPKSCSDANLQSIHVQQQTKAPVSGLSAAAGAAQCQNTCLEPGYILIWL